MNWHGRLDPDPLAPGDTRLIVVTRALACIMETMAVKCCHYCSVRKKQLQKCFHKT